MKLNKEQKICLAFIIFGVCMSLILFDIPYASAMTINFFYSPTCPHCQNVIPTIQSLMQKYIEPCYKWLWHDVTQMSYDIQGVPTIKITTSDSRTIEITGDTPILKRLPCELNEQSTPQCITYSAESNHKGSWFVN